MTRDPAWYSDIRELVAEYAAAGRIDARTGAALRDRLLRAERHGVAGRDAAASAQLLQVVAVATKDIRGDRAARDAVLRPTLALIAIVALVD
ncbi:FIMAH domain-containing protein [Phytohabitans kaempferiae]|uniref:FIMAH domain-containing protein n=1 Tax=Phytohabitans kaempferiae TaxID=1620943 RepID=A0ABV6MHE7_9ACTN